MGLVSNSTRKGLISDKKLSSTSNSPTTLTGANSQPSESAFIYFDDLWRYDIRTEIWTELKLQNGPSGRAYHIAEF